MLAIINNTKLVMWYVACICTPGMQGDRGVEMIRRKGYMFLEETCIIKVKRKSETPMKTFFLSWKQTSKQI